MKTNNHKPFLSLFLCLIMTCISVSLSAQLSHDYITVTGVVKDKRTNKKLEYVNVSLMGTNVGTITNSDGAFSLKIKDSLEVKVLDISHLGYTKERYVINSAKTKDLVISIVPNSRNLKEVVIEPVDPFLLVKKAIEKIGENNSPNKNMLVGFYRETVRKRKNYITISEAIINIYKTPYTEGVEEDRVQIFKGRKLLSPKPSDTLLVKLQGGPALSTYLDIVKNKEMLFDLETLAYYKFKIEDPIMIEDRLNYVVSFEPQVVLPNPLFKGFLFIDKENLTFTRAEINLDMSDKNKATQAILKKKPFGMHFKPEEVSFLINYKTKDGISYLNYIRNEVRFKCDWKRKLFSTGYTIVSEMVVTDRIDKNVSNISYRKSFDQNQVLSDKVKSFYDVNFWEDYNIIEPTESLEAAVGKLKRQQ